MALNDHRGTMNASPPTTRDTNNTPTTPTTPRTEKLNGYKMEKTSKKGDKITEQCGTTATTTGRREGGTRTEGWRNGDDGDGDGVRDGREGITKSSTNIKRGKVGEVFRLVALGSLLEGDRL